MTPSLPVPPADPRDIETPAARVCAQFYLRAAAIDMHADRDAPEEDSVGTRPR